MKLLTTVLSTAVLFGVGRSVALADDAAPGAADDRARNRDVRLDAPRVERIKGAYLGVATSPPTPIVREQLQLGPGMGLVVEVVERGSPADQAGVKANDVMTKLGDQVLVNAEQLAVLVRNKKPGDEVELTVVRGGAPTTLKAKLIEHDLPRLEEVYFFRGGPDAAINARAPFDAQAFKNLKPEIKEWLERHEPGKHGAAGEAHGEGHADAHAEAHATGNRTQSQSAASWSDGEHTLTVTTESDKPGRHLVAKDKDGAVLFDGDLDAPGAQDSLPSVVKEKLKRMEGTGVQPPKPGDAPAKP